MDSALIADDNPVLAQIDTAAAHYGVDPNLAHIVAQMESGYDPKAVSSVGAQGVMQLMPDTATSLGVRNPFDSAQNVDAGVRYLSQLQRKYAGDPRLVLAAYNAGPGAVDKYGGVPPYDETQKYVKHGLALLSSVPKATPAVKEPTPEELGLIPDTAPVEAQTPSLPSQAASVYKRLSPIFAGTSPLGLMGQISGGFGSLLDRFTGNTPLAAPPTPEEKNAFEAAKSIVMQPLQELHRAQTAWMNGDTAGTATHLGNAIPFIGPVGQTIGGYLDKGDVPGALTAAAGAATPFLLHGITSGGGAAEEGAGGGGGEPPPPPSPPGKVVTAIRGGFQGAQEALPAARKAAIEKAAYGAFGGPKGMATAGLTAAGKEIIGGAIRGAREALAPPVAEAVPEAALPETPAPQTGVPGYPEVTLENVARGLNLKKPIDEWSPEERQTVQTAYDRIVQNLTQPKWESPYTPPAETAAPEAPAEPQAAPEATREPAAAPATPPAPEAPAASLTRQEQAAQHAIELEAMIRPDRLTEYAIRNEIPSGRLAGYGDQDWQTMAQQTGTRPPTPQDIQTIVKNIQEYEKAQGITEPAELTPEQLKAEFQKKLEYLRDLMARERGPTPSAPTGAAAAAPAFEEAKAAGAQTIPTESVVEPAAANQAVTESAEAARSRGLQGISETLDKAAQDAMNRMRARGTFNGTRMNAGVPVEDMADMAIWGASKIAKGVTDFAQWSKEMLADAGPAAAEQIRPQLQKMYAQAQKIYARHIQKTASLLPNTEKLLDLYQQGKEGADWYANTKSELEKIFGPDANMMVDFLAATSPNATVKANVALALKAYEQWKLGKPFSGFMGDVIENLNNAAEGRDFGKLKVQSFRKNLYGDPMPVTVDRWIARAMGFRKGVTEPQYKFMDYYLSQVANKYGMEPRQIQAAIWKAIKDTEGLPGQGGENFETLVKQKLARDPRTANIIRELTGYSAGAP